VASVVVDSDVLIDALNGREPSLSRVRGAIDAGSAATTAVNACEVLAGATTPRRLREAEALLGFLPVLPLDEASGRVAGAVRRDLAGRGQIVPTADCLIAAICMTQGLPLLTRNVAHFSRIPGLTLATM
jgi:predicted nucleic acid-binding protein